MTTVKMLMSDFQAREAEIRSALTVGLEKELADCAWQADPNSDLWDLPTVDSKTVCKLSPIVEKMIGQKLHAKWVRKGGYESVESAINDLMARIAENCVAPAAMAIAAE